MLPRHYSSDKRNVYKGWMQIKAVITLMSKVPKSRTVVNSGMNVWNELADSSDKSNLGVLH